MGFDRSKFGVAHMSMEKLSAGLCDNCKCPDFINTSGNGEPHCYELYCEKKKIFIEPVPLEDQVKKCEFFEMK